MYLFVNVWRKKIDLIFNNDDLCIFKVGLIFILERKFF